MRANLEEHWAELMGMIQLKSLDQEQIWLCNAKIKKEAATIKWFE
jgi:hypothetical protein